MSRIFGSPRYRGALVISCSGYSPLLADGAFVHDAAYVIGRVQLGREASVWPNATIRGDTERIAVGDRTNVQDGAVLHADPGFPCLVGSDVTIGHQACVHGCVVEDAALVGIGAIVLNGARIGSGSIVGAGAVVTEGTVIPPGSLAVGAPARVIRPSTEAQRADILRSAAHYAHMIGVHGG